MISSYPDFESLSGVTQFVDASEMVDASVHTASAHVWQLRSRSYFCRLHLPWSQGQGPVGNIAIAVE